MHTRVGKILLGGVAFDPQHAHGPFDVGHHSVEHAGLTATRLPKNCERLRVARLRTVGGVDEQAHVCVSPRQRPRVHSLTISASAAIRRVLARAARTPHTPVVTTGDFHLGPGHAGEMTTREKTSARLTATLITLVCIPIFALGPLATSAHAALIDGTEGDDVLEGTNDDDTIFGLGGNDILRGHGGDDALWGGAGDDQLYGGDGNDLGMGNEGNDYIEGNAGNDNLYGGEHDDVIYGGDGDDVIAGDGGEFGDTGADGDDELWGEAGNDIIRGDGGNDFIDGGTGHDTLFGNQGDDIIYGGDGDDVIFGGEGDDLIYGDAGDDIIYGDEGDDALFGGDGDDRIHGGDGFDIIVGGAGDDDLRGEGGRDLISGGAGNDRLSGGAGNDDLFGNEGDDILFGDDGNDLLCGGGDAGDQLYGGAGSDLACAHDDIATLTLGVVEVFDPTVNDEVLLDEGVDDSPSVYSLISVPTQIDASIAPDTGVITLSVIDPTYAGGTITYRVQRDHPDGNLYSDADIEVTILGVTYTVTFETNGGSTVPDATVAHGDVVAPPADPTQEGYAFTGWYSDTATTSTYNFAEPVLSDLSIYAGWNETELGTGPVLPGDSGAAGTDEPAGPAGTALDAGPTGGSSPIDTSRIEALATTGTSLASTGFIVILALLSVAGGLVLIRRRTTHE